MAKRRRGKKGPTTKKARKMLKDGRVRGRPLTKRQKKFLGARAS